MKKAELLILNKMINTYIISTRAELANMQSEALKLKKKQQEVHQKVISTNKEDVTENINQYLKSEINFRLTEKIFGELNDNISKRDMWSKIRNELPQFQIENDTSIDVKTDTVSEFPKELERDLIQKLISLYEEREKYEVCSFLMNKVGELQEVA